MSESASGDSTPRHSAEPRVSVVIPTFNRLGDLQRAINGLAEQTLPHDEFEVIIVDNSSTDGTEAWAATLETTAPMPVRYIRKTPEGPSVARNTGIRHARGRYVVVTDSDVVLQIQWLARALDTMETNPDQGCVAGRVVYAHDDEHLNAYGGAIGPIGLAWDHAEGQRLGAADQPRQALWINCSAMMIRTKLARDLGGFDERFFYGYEDSDLGWRVNLAGFRVDVLPDLVAYHYVETEIRPSSPTIVYHYCKNRLRSIVKNYGPARLAFYGPVYLLYAICDAALRPPRTVKILAILWNVRHLPDTLRARWAVQRKRTVSDTALRPLFANSWFPPTPLAGRRRRPAVDTLSPTASRVDVLGDDRVH